MILRIALLLCLPLALGGCASLVSSATARMADNVTVAIQNQDDLATVRDGAPAYLIMIDGLIEGDPENVKLLLSGARLYGSYTSAFLIDDPERARRLAAKSLEYARRGLCAQDEAVCEALDGRLDNLEEVLTTTNLSDLPALYEYAAAWSGWIRLNASDWNAIADVSRVTALFEHCLVLDETYDNGGAHVYLGVIKSFLPATLGGQPEVGREHFERAIEISAGHNQMIKVLMAEHYARNIFDKELHDKLLNEVLEADPVYPEFTLINMLAKQQATKLLAESDDFF
jgi:hypothetical protein